MYSKTYKKVNRKFKRRAIISSELREQSHACTFKSDKKLNYLMGRIMSMKEVISRSAIIYTHLWRLYL